MKRFTLLVCMCMIAAPTYAADDPQTRGGKLLEQHHYNEAIVLLRSAIVTLDPAKEGVAFLSAGVAYLRNAELHRELSRAALTTGADYLKKLAADTGPGRSRMAGLFLGELLLEAGNLDAAAASLEKFAANEAMDKEHREIARVLLGSVAFRSGNAAKADEVWASVDRSDAEVRTELGLAFSRAGLTDRGPVTLIDEAIAAFRREGKKLPARVQKNALAVYLQAGLVDRAMEIVRGADLKAPLEREHVGPSKDINFYSASLHQDLAHLYLKAALAVLEKASKDGRTKDIANFHRSEVHALLGETGQARTALTDFIANDRIPHQFRSRAKARLAAIEYQEGRQDEGKAAWDALIKKNPNDPALLEETLLACGRLGADCPRAARQAGAVAAEGQGRKLAPLQAALGRYLLGKGKSAQGRALAALEAARDKGNKNKIEPNDPALLVDLADLYYRTKKFSEALEIYFEMGKQFPEVRSIQEPLQGIYSMEQKSAGDARIN